MSKNHNSIYMGGAIWDADQGLPSPYIVEDKAIDGVMIGLSGYI